ncbi:hypothetical protein BDV98DRAFT_599201 [Pterulicium gracile]|uniref:Uncharacterized protein n=1 Tax=Pterulicium gracile TaxID=1884261 RepID=A0A5C3Q1W9_9AGAR|nr:hypothetical protein BDV98DRAFT_599201 [Pterula gracilis]
MLPGDGKKKAVVMLEKPVPAIKTRASVAEYITGVIDNTIVVTTLAIANPGLTSDVLKSESTVLFITEAKSQQGVSLPNHVAQTVTEMILDLPIILDDLRQQFIRGTLTNGHTWIFLTVEVDENQDRSKFWHSKPVT